MNYHVSINGSDCAEGTKEHPFRNISHAAMLAEAGDTVIVHAGIYREWVSPRNGGTKEKRITYCAAGDGEVVITGAEPVKKWRDEGDGVWSTEVDNAIFTVRNPYQEKLHGDWLFRGEFEAHLGDVYLNQKSLYECESVEEVRAPKVWPNARYQKDSLLKWYAQAGDKSTKIWANFGGKDPRKEDVEINVRPYCFWPKETGRNYITVKGFTMRQASPQWAPPTALQEGLIGPHWSRGWIIEENVISESKCAGISLGKEAAAGENEWSNEHIKGGTQREQEVIFRALRGNWKKEEIGSHIVRNNMIHDCEQAGIVGHLGGAFCTISRNRIYNIHHKRIFHGAEVAGIKLHAALDTQIWGNSIYRCFRAVWLDWQAQGTRLSRNVFFDNLAEDLMVEVCHGPYTVDHNLFLSGMNFRNLAEGGAFVHNLFAGRFVLRSEINRHTPYHVPHETSVAGYCNICGGDDRFYNNIFLRDEDESNEPLPMTFFEMLPVQKREETVQTAAMDGVPDSSRCYLYPVGLGAYGDYPIEREKEPWDFTEEEKADRIRRFGRLYKPGRWCLPVFAHGNVYFRNAFPGAIEPDAKIYEEKGVEITVIAEEGRVIVAIPDTKLFAGCSAARVTTDVLGKTHHAEMHYEDPEGKPLDFCQDFNGNQRPLGGVTPGPFEITEERACEYIL